MTESPTDTVRHWIDTINRRDRAAFLAASHEEIAFYNPAGVGIGHDVVSDWFDTNPMRITVKSMTGKHDMVLVAHHIGWLDADGAVAYEIDNQAVIKVRDGKVASYARLEDAAESAADFETETDPR